MHDSSCVYAILFATLHDFYCLHNSSLCNTCCSRTLCNHCTNATYVHVMEVINILLAIASTQLVCVTLDVNLEGLEPLETSTIAKDQYAPNLNK